MNTPEVTPLTAALKCYLDGSGDSSDPAVTHLTLGGLIGTPEAFNEFELLWNRVLQRWGCPYLHMKDAQHLRGPFIEERGWTDEKVRRLICDLVNNCLTSAAHGKHKDAFYGATCTVNLADYREACSDLPGLQQVKTAEALCVDHVVGQALRWLPPNDSDPTGKTAGLELCFDRGERFRHQIGRVWERQRKKPGIFGLITRITDAVSATTPALQAADLIAWHATRGYYRNDGMELFAAMIVPSIPRYLDYDGIVKIGTKVLARQVSWDRPRANATTPRMS
jgi:hypothetical protein